MLKSQHAVSKRKNSLAQKIIVLLIILVVAGLLEIGFGFILLNRYRTEIRDMENTVLNTYITRTNQTFNMINANVRSLLFESSEIENITDTYIGDQTAQVASFDAILLQNDAIMTLKNTFLTLVKNYGNKFNFFFYDTQNHNLTEYGGREYYERKPFINLLLSQIEDHSIQYTKEGKWFLNDQFICTIYSGPKGIAGAWIQASDFAANILALSPTHCSSLSIYNPDTGTNLTFHRNENGTLSQDTSESTGNLNNFFNPTNARFSLLFKIDAQEYESTLLYPILFLITIIIYLFFVILAVIYVRKNILHQVNFFYDSLMEFKNTATFNEKSGLVEFAETGKVLNKLAEEIQKLKIDIYEKQLEKQKIELDYAQLQIRPHFYINCLNVIHSMAQVNLTEQIQEITFQVSGYLRYIFQKSMEPVTVEKEINFTKNYLKVLECMNDSMYPCQISVLPSLNSFEIPPLLIQTFVENALKHNMVTDSFCSIEISVATQTISQCDYLEITIKDNGRGFDTETLEQLNAGQLENDPSGHHIGIQNAIARLKMLYDERARAVFSNNPAGGACVQILIPFKQEELQ